jgi:hypothetical protein
MELSRGNVESAIILLREGGDIYRATGAMLWHSYHKMLLSDAMQHDERGEEALRILDGEISVVAMEADLHRRRGQLLFRRIEQDCSSAEAEFLEAITVAQAQSAKLLELRAAVGLAVLRHSQGQLAEARDLLASVYNWFTEGFDTPDLKDARALLDELQ